MIDIEELRRLAKAATQGKWTIETTKINFGDDVTELLANGHSIMGNEAYYPWVPKVADFKYIAAVGPEVVCELLDERERMVSLLTEAILAASAAGAVPEGWKLVPVDPTDEVVIAIEAVVDEQLIASAIRPVDMFRQDGASIYSAAMAVAPTPPAAFPGVDIDKAHNKEAA